MFESPLTTLVKVAAVFMSIAIVDILLQLIIRRLVGKRIVVFEATSLFSLLVGGTIVLRRLIPEKLYFVSALCWFGVAVLNYFQVKGFFSRGYSVRILVDLWRRGTPDSIVNMKNNYAGMGIRGLLLKRVGSLAFFGLVRFNGIEVGPIKFLGTCSALYARAHRQALRLINVG